MSSSSSILREIGETIRQLYRRLQEFGIPPIFKITALILFLYAVKENLKGVFGFDCPHVDYKFYGNMYIYGPAVIFVCFALVYSRSFWEFIMGFCCKKRLLTSPKSAIDIYLAFSAPILWIAFAFLEKDYYICATYGPEVVESRYHRYYERSTGYYGRATEEMNDQHLYVHAGSQCQIIAWGIILAWGLTSTAVVSLHRCCIKHSEAEKTQKGVMII